MPNPSPNMGVTQEARDAAADLAEWLGGLCQIGGNDIAAIRNGFWDNDEHDLGNIVRAFAKFEQETIARTTSLTGAPGSGEVEKHHAVFTPSSPQSDQTH